MPLSDPFMARPIGERAMETMTASGMETPILCRIQWRKCGGGGVRIAGSGMHQKYAIAYFLCARTYWLD